MLQKYWKDYIVFFGILVTIVISKWSFLDVPFFYEEQPGTLVYVQNQKLIDLITGNYNHFLLKGHHFFVPLFINKLIVLLDVLGVSGTFHFKVHLVFSVLSTFTLFFTYKILTSIFNLSVFKSLIIVILLFSYPDYFVHSSNYRIDIFTLICATLYLYFRSKNHFLGFLLSGIVLAQTRETVLAFIISTLIVDSYRCYKFQSSRKFLIANAIHLFAYGYFFIITFLKNDSLSVSPAFSEINSSIIGYLKILAFDLKWLFISDYRFVLTSLMIPCLYILYKRNEKLKIEYLYFFVPLLFYCLGMAFHIFEASYYLIPTLTCLYIVLLFPIFKVVSSKYLVLLFILMLQLNIKSDELKASEQLAENSTKYVEITKNYIEVNKYIGEVSGSTVNAEWPLSVYLVKSLYGYGESHSFVMSMFDNIWSTELGHRVEIVDCNKVSFDYIIIDNQSPVLKRNSQEKIVEKCKYKLVKRFSKNWFKVDIYEKY